MDSPRRRERVKTCQRCGKEYQGGGYKFCSEECATASEPRAKVCKRCGKEYTGGGYKFCSPECMLGTGTCKRCGKGFQRGFVGQRFCKECHGKSELKVCQGCGGTFGQTTPGQVYCSKGCYERSRARVPASCPVCGKGVPKGRTYCSVGCRERVRAMRAKMAVCPVCGKEFKGRTRKGRMQKYCSPECQRKGQRKREDKVCQVCGRTFHPHSNAKGLFCSHECFGIAFRGEDAHCPVCGKVLERDEHYNRPKYCSEDCKEKARATARRLAEEKRAFEDTGFERAFEDTLEWMDRLSKTAPRKCALCGGEYVPVAVTQIRCSRCAKYLRDNRGDLRIYRNGMPDLSITLKKLYERDKGYCRGCGRHIEFVEDYNSDDYPSIDHIVPIARGGTHTWDNVQLMCRGCNSLKRDDMPAALPKVFQTRLTV